MEIYEACNKMTEKLDRIIELLELRTSVESARYEMVAGEAPAAPVAICRCHEKGDSTAVLTCPLHG